MTPRTALFAAVVFLAAAAGFGAGWLAAMAPTVPDISAAPVPSASAAPDVEAPTTPPVAPAPAPAAAPAADSARTVASAEPVAPPATAAPAPGTLPSAESLFGLEIPEHPSAEDLRRAAASLGPGMSPKRDPATALRVALYERLLREFPSDAGAAQDFDALYRLYLSRGEPDRAGAALEQYGGTVGLRGFQRENYLANIASLRRDWEAYRGHVQRIVDDPEAPESEKVSGQFWIAYSWSQQGDAAQAKALYQSLLDRYGSRNDPLLRDSVEGAREQIRILESAKK
jgi:tetratricopeptide (TPR) repeat protein